jgi:lysozyme
MGMLQWAGMVSGAGQGLERGLSQMQAQIGAHGLAEEADKRLVAREDTAYTRKRWDINDERAYSDTLREKLYQEGRRHTDQTAEDELSRRERNLGRTAGIEERESDERKSLRDKIGNEKVERDIGDTEKKTLAGLSLEAKTVEQRAELAAKTFKVGEGLRADTRREAVQGKIEDTVALGENEPFRKASQSIVDAAVPTSEKEARAAQVKASNVDTETKTYKLTQDKEIGAATDAIVAAINTGDQAKIQRAMEVHLAKSGKLMEAQKIDQTTAATLAKETSIEATRLRTEMDKQVPGDPQYESNKRRLTQVEAMNAAFTARALLLSGSIAPAGPKAYQITDPRDAKKAAPGGMVTEAQKTPTEPAPPAPAPTPPSGPTAMGRLGEAITGAISPYKAPTKEPEPITPGRPTRPPAALPPADEQARMLAATRGEEPTRTVPAPPAAEQEKMLAATRGGDEGPSGLMAAAQEQPEGQAGGRDARVMKLLRAHEGESDQPYPDSRGNQTVGIGHNLQAKPLDLKPGEKLTPERQEQVFKEDVTEARTEAAKLRYYNDLDPTRQDAVTALVYNMGLKGVQGFKKFNVAMEQGNWQLARQELLRSDWAKQVGSRRASQMADMILNGRYSF